ncbi:hypothetical protein [Caldicellulosiruptor naganoensis]|uniref:Uncharacterized protein n=1 Tax=Caldicellulosiruptor naganoensis TaxID=29324 RepID=A0ABY7BFW0_9FIRM|nr:hypothetical protein [Caldicellulosiruptor naganoensis]WAM31699.1 hypothetical protein OTJ99_000133 [Caldicellulosiruptor naganoensis]
MFEIPVYDLSEILKGYYKITWEDYTFSSKKIPQFRLEPIYQSDNNILFLMKKKDIPEDIIESIIVLSLKNGKVEQTINYKLKNKISQIIFFNEEKFILIGYTMALINAKFGKIKIFIIDPIRKVETLMYSFIVELSGVNKDEELLIPFASYVLALNERYIMLINIDMNFKDKSVLIADLYDKSELYLNPYIIDEHSIFEISYAEIKKFKNKDYLLISTGRICPDEKRDYFNLGKEDIINKINTLLVIPCEELIQDLNKGIIPVLSKYLIDKAEYSEMLAFLEYGKLNYGFFYRIKSNFQYIDSQSILYGKENFTANITDIFSFDLETKKRTYIGSLSIPLEKIHRLYKEENKYFLLCSSFYPYSIPAQNYFIKHYIGTNEISSFDLPINIPPKELIEEFYFLKNLFIAVTVDPVENYMHLYFSDEDIPIVKVRCLDEFFLLTVHPETEELSSVIIYPRFLIK